MFNFKELLSNYFLKACKEIIKRPRLQEVDVKKKIGIPWISND
jgi:hypothetical protein